MIAYGWLAWLLLFLAYEVPAAIAEWYYQKFRGERRRITLSRNCWKWLGLEKGQEWRPYRRARQACMFVFLQTLAFHIAFAHPGGAWIIATGVPVAAIIAYAVFVEDRRARYWARRFDPTGVARGNHPACFMPIPPQRISIGVRIDTTRTKRRARKAGRNG